MYVCYRSGMDGRTWFVAGTVPLIAAGGLHAVATLVDTVRPTFFVPLDRAAASATERTGIELRRMFGGDGARPSMWRVWLGINISHGVAIAAFALLCLLIAVHDWALVGEIGALRPMTIAFSAAYLALSLRFWFYGPLLITATSTACFTVSAVVA
jgi:hypothetical protein